MSKKIDFLPEGVGIEKVNIVNMYAQHNKQITTWREKKILLKIVF